MEEKLELLKELDEAILQVYPTDEIEGDIVEANEENSRILKVISECKQFISTSEKPAEACQCEMVTVLASAEETGRKSPQTRVSLKPVVKQKFLKLTMPKFNGEVTKFRAF